MKSEQEKRLYRKRLPGRPAILSKKENVFEEAQYEWDYIAYILYGAALLEQVCNCTSLMAQSRRPWRTLLQL